MTRLPSSLVPVGLAATALAAAIVAALRRQRRLRSSGLGPRPGHSQPRRDLRGYGPHPPVFQWPNGARLAINFAINIEEGSEPSIPDGDAASTAALCECPSDAPVGVRDLAAESMFEYGSRVGIYRVLRAFESRGVPATAFACALALERLPEVAAAVRRGMAEGSLDVCCHGYRWEDHVAMDPGEERERISQAVASLSATLGGPPPGWYCRTAPSIHTRRLLVEHGGFEYDSDAYNDELPYWAPVELSDGRTAHHLVLPYTLCTNDSKFAPGRAFSTADDFFDFCRAAVDTLLAESEQTRAPRMLSIGLHPRLIGHPARIGGLHRLLDYLTSLGPSKVWIAQRLEIARAWRALHPPPGAAAVAAGAPPAAEGLPRGLPAATAAAAAAPPRLLITGGAGFVLSHVARTWLMSNVDGTCVIFDKPGHHDDEARCFLAPLLASGRLVLFAGDVGDAVSWARLARTHGTDFTHVVAGAAITPTAEEEAARGLDIARVNLFGALQAFDFARARCRSLRRFLLISSDAVLSVPPLGGPTHCRPETPAVPSYALSKLAAEAQVRRWAQLHPDVDAVAVRFSDVYGAMDRDTGARNRHNAPYWVVTRALHREAIVIEAASLDELGWDYIDAPSAARGVSALLDAPHRLKRFVYELALGRCVAHAELLAAVCGASPERMREPGVLEDFARRFAPIELVPPCSSPFLGPHVVRSLSEDHWLRSYPMQVDVMREELGWEPTPFAVAVREYMSWLAESRHIEGSAAPGAPLVAEAPTLPASSGSLPRAPPEEEITQAAPPSLAGLTMVVSGGASGIGRGIVAAAASRGCHVIYMDTRDSPLEGGPPTTEVAAGATGDVLHLPGDVTVCSDVERAVSTAVARYGRLDVFVNNAALDLTDPPHEKKQSLTEASLEEFERVQRVNTTGYFLGAQAAVKQFLKQAPRSQTGLRGKLINITSQHGMVACPGNLPYGVSKAAGVYMTKQIAVDYAQDLISCNAVAPGKIVKEPARPVAPYSRARTPCPRLGTPADVARAVCWLAGDEVGSYVTGHNLTVDGGWMAY